MLSFQKTKNEISENLLRSGVYKCYSYPVFLLVSWNKKLNEPVPNVMDMGIYAKHKNLEEYKTSKVCFESFRNWKFKKIIIQPNAARKNSKYYVSELKKLQTKNQKETGIEFIIGNNNTYDDFISLLNDMEIAKQEYYGIDMDKTGHFFAVHIYKDPNAKESKYEYLLYNDVISEYYEPSFHEKITYQFTEFGKLPKQAFYIIFGYLILLNISVLSLARKSI